MKLLLLLIVLVGTQLRSAAQCTYAPADCPESTGYGSTDDSTNRMGNPVLPLEITMENRLRHWTAALIDRIASKEHWRYAELAESSSSGARAADGSVLAYPLRPPHWMQIQYQLIVSEDSLSAWQTWLQTFAQRRLDATMAYAKQQASQAAATKANDDFENERRRRTIHFREAATVIVEFDFNMDYVKTAGTATSSATPATPATTTIWFNNSNPEFNSIDAPERVHANALVLAGSFNKTPDGQGYRPAWINDKTATNLSAPKKLKSDQIQSIDCHLSGNPSAIRLLLAGFSPGEWTGLLAHP
jgi:hypothetical protein